MKLRRVLVCIRFLIPQAVTITCDDNRSLIVVLRCHFTKQASVKTKPSLFDTEFDFS